MSSHRAPENPYSEAAKIIRYYLEHQNFPRWEDMSPSEQDVANTCLNLEQMMLEEALKLDGRRPKERATAPRAAEDLLSEIGWWFILPTVLLTEKSPRKWVRVIGFFGVLLAVPLWGIGAMFLLAATVAGVFGDL